MYFQETSWLHRASTTLRVNKQNFATPIRILG